MAQCSQAAKQHSPGLHLSGALGFSTDSTELDLQQGGEVGKVSSSETAKCTGHAEAAWQEAVLPEAELHVVELHVSLLGCYQSPCASVLYQSATLRWAVSGTEITKTPLERS